MSAAKRLKTTPQLSELSASAQNYLKVIWAAGEWSDASITASELAKKLELRKSTVSEGLKKLVEQGLVREGSLELTDVGATYAVAMIRRHRLLETFLVAQLGYTWDQVHDEAEHLEHAVSDFMIDRIDQVLGYPTKDPHGDPIPTAAGKVIDSAAQPLSGVTAGQFVVERISDTDPQLLQYLHSHGVKVGCELAVQPGPPFSDSLQIAAEGAEFALGKRAADAIFVTNKN